MRVRKFTLPRDNRFWQNFKSFEDSFMALYAICLFIRLFTFHLGFIAILAFLMEVCESAQFTPLVLWFLDNA